MIFIFSPNFTLPVPVFTPELSLFSCILSAKWNDENIEFIHFKYFTIYSPNIPTNYLRLTLLQFRLQDNIKECLFIFSISHNFLCEKVHKKSKVDYFAIATDQIIFTVNIYVAVHWWCKKWYWLTWLHFLQNVKLKD